MTNVLGHTSALYDIYLKLRLLKGEKTQIS